MKAGRTFFRVASRFCAHTSNISLSYIRVGIKLLGSLDLIYIFFITLTQHKRHEVLASCVKLLVLLTLQIEFLFVNQGVLKERIVSFV
jgi:hypothetical protein